MFPEGQPISEDAGKALADWSRGGTAPPAIVFTPELLAKRQGRAGNADAAAPA
jgi:hypothetical protein